jgi:pimeloyl-ACP methyl ester carboxylesterase
MEQLMKDGLEHRAEIAVPVSSRRKFMRYLKLFSWNEVPKGGHFAALEQPELFVAELRKSFAQVR